MIGVLQLGDGCSELLKGRGGETTDIVSSIRNAYEWTTSISPTYPVLSDPSASLTYLTRKCARPMSYGQRMLKLYAASLDRLVQTIAFLSQYQFLEVAHLRGVGTLTKPEALSEIYSDPRLVILVSHVMDSVSVVSSEINADVKEAEEDVIDKLNQDSSDSTTQTVDINNFIEETMKHYTPVQWKPREKNDKDNQVIFATPFEDSVQVLGVSDDPNDDTPGLYINTQQMSSLSHPVTGKSECGTKWLPLWESDAALYAARISTYGIMMDHAKVKSPAYRKLQEMEKGITRNFHDFPETFSKVRSTFMKPLLEDVLMILDAAFHHVSIPFGSSREVNTLSQALFDDAAARRNRAKANEDWEKRTRKRDTVTEAVPDDVAARRNRIRANEEWERRTAGAKGTHEKLK